MIKSELVARLAEANPHLYQRDVERIVSTIFDEIAAALSRGDRVELRGFMNRMRLPISTIAFQSPSKAMSHTLSASNCIFRRCVFRSTALPAARNASAHARSVPRPPGLPDCPLWNGIALNNK